MSGFPNKFTIPKDRIPKVWSQGLYNCCVAASITKCLEVINYVKTGEYVMFSKGYTYGKHSRPDKTQGGMDYTYAMNSLLKYGTVPEEMFPILDEVPDIMEKVNNHPELDKEAEKTKIKSFTKIKGDIYFYDNVKRLLYEKQMPLVGNMVGKRHCTVIVGWDGNQLLYQDHDGRDRLIKGKFNEAYYLEGSNGGEDTPMKLIELKDFKSYVDSLKLTRSIKLIQLHHTYSPAYKHFTGNNHLDLQKAMRNYHMKTNRWADIGQHFTIFPDGKICTGRDINNAPAGIKGANSNGICIECLGNFDKGGDSMTDAQKNSIVAVTKILLDKFGLDAKTDVIYHAWWTSDGKSLGNYVVGKSNKSCPGSNFFGGNTREAYEKNLMPLIKIYGKVENDMALKPVTEINDIVWELTNAGITTNGELWLKKCKEDVNVYWLCRKMANKLRGTLE